MTHVNSSMQSAAQNRFSWTDLTFSWSDVKTKLPNGTQELVFVKCTERPTDTFVQLSKDGGVSIVLCISIVAFLMILSQTVRRHDHALERLESAYIRQ